MLSYTCLIHRLNLPSSVKECRIIHKNSENRYHEITLTSQRRLTNLTQNENVEYVTTGGEKYQSVYEILDSPISTPFYYISPDLRINEIRLLIQSICSYWIEIAQNNLKFSNDLTKLPLDFLRLVANIQANNKVIYLFKNFLISDPKFNADRHFKILIQILKLFLLSSEREKNQKGRQNGSYFFNFDLTNLAEFMQCMKPVLLQEKIRLIYSIYCPQCLHYLDLYNFSRNTIQKRLNV